MLTQKQVTYAYFLNDFLLTSRYHHPSYDALKSQNLINILLSYEVCSPDIIDKVIRDTNIDGKRIAKAIEVIDRGLLQHYLSCYDLPVNALSQIFETLDGESRDNNYLLKYFKYQSRALVLPQRVKDKLGI